MRGPKWMLDVAVACPRPEPDTHRHKASQVTGTFRGAGHLRYPHSPPEFVESLSYGYNTSAHTLHAVSVDADLRSQPSGIRSEV